jgi:hypothetical protein
MPFSAIELWLQTLKQWRYEHGFADQLNMVSNPAMILGAIATRSRLDVVLCVQEGFEDRMTPFAGCISHVVFIHKSYELWVMTTRPTKTGLRITPGSSSQVSQS